VGCYALSSAYSPHLFQHYSELPLWERRDWNSRCGHIAHAVIVVALVALTLTRCPGFWGDSVGAGEAPSTVLDTVTPLSVATFAFSLGYFATDTVMMLALHTQPLGMMLGHHLGGAVALAAVLATGECHYYGLLLLSTEV